MLSIAKPKLLTCSVSAPLNSHMQKAVLLDHDAARIKSVKLAQTKALISCAITQLICAFYFAYTKSRFANYAAQNKVFLFSTNIGADQL